MEAERWQKGKNGPQGNSEQARTSQEGGTLHDPNETPRAIWSYTGERDNIGQALRSLGITVQVGVREARSEEPDYQGSRSISCTYLRYLAA